MVQININKIRFKYIKYISYSLLIVLRDIINYIRYSIIDY